MIIDSFARLISILFVPPSFTLITFILFAFHLETEQIKIIVTILVALLFGFIAPIILFFKFRKRGLIIDLDASIKEERTLPMAISISFFFIGIIILLLFKINIVSIAFWFCYISNTLITIFINKLWKISAHTMGAAGPLAALLVVFGPIALLFMLITILVGWSRIRLKCHSISQVLAGGVMAFISTYLQIIIITRIYN